MKNFLTILLALAKIGSLYAKTYNERKKFQAAAAILLMIIIIKNEESKKKYSNQYNRYGKRGSDEF